MYEKKLLLSNMKQCMNSIQTEEFATIVSENDENKIMTYLVSKLKPSLQGKTSPEDLMLTNEENILFDALTKIMEETNSTTSSGVAKIRKNPMIKIVLAIAAIIVVIILLKKYVFIPSRPEDKAANTKKTEEKSNKEKLEKKD